MSKVARAVRAIPHRSAGEAWEVIAGLLAPQGGAARDEMMRVAGIASSLITAEAPKDDKIVVWGGGPRVHVSCVYGDDAVTGDGAEESQLARSPTEGDWAMSLPCPEEELSWVQPVMAKKSDRITARKLGENLDTDTDTDQGGSATSASIDKEAFLRP
jgi:hypothetical protein